MSTAGGAGADQGAGLWARVIRQQQALARLGQLGLQAADLEEILREALRLVADALGVIDVALFEVIADAEQLLGRAALHQGMVVPRPTIERLALDAGRGSLPGFAADLGIPVASADLAGDPRFEAAATQLDLPLKAGVAAPIAWDRTPWGVLGAWSREVREWTDDEVAFVQAVASTVGLAVQRHQVEQSLRDSNLRLDLSLSAGGLGSWSWDTETDEVWLSPTSLAMHGITTGAFGGRADEFLALVHPEDRVAIRASLVDSVAAGREPHGTYRAIRRDRGEVRWIEVWGRVVDAGRTIVGVSLDITDRRLADERRDAALAREHAARVDAELARERLAFLSDASARLGTSLDPEVLLDTLVGLLVPVLADVCVLDLVDEAGALAEAAARAVEPEAVEVVRAIRAKRAAHDGGGGGLTSAHHRESLAHSVLYAEITDELWRLAALDEEHLALLHRLRARSSLSTPLVARDRVIGVITLFRREGSVRYTEDDLALAEELAGRAALALDNGRLYHSRNRVARSLQQALLPPALPEIPGLAIATRYQVADTDVAIGGDFYDVVDLGDGRWSVVVGDVCGRGPDAAALTGLIRHSLRTVLVRESEPDRVLRQVNAAVIDQIDDASFCTAALLRITPLDGPNGPDGGGVGVRVEATSAGHPLPVLVRADGEASLVPCAGTLLGVVREPRLTGVRVDLAPGDALVLYTDGVTEARRAGELFGDDRLLAAARSLAGRPADEVAAGIEEAVVAWHDHADDDVAIVVLQAAPAPGAPSG